MNMKRFLKTFGSAIATASLMVSVADAKPAPKAKPRPDFHPVEPSKPANGGTPPRVNVPAVGGKTNTTPKAGSSGTTVAPHLSGDAPVQGAGAFAPVANPIEAAYRQNLDGALSRVNAAQAKAELAKIEMDPMLKAHLDSNPALAREIVAIANLEGKSVDAIIARIDATVKSARDDGEIKAGEDTPELIGQYARAIVGLEASLGSIGLPEAYSLANLSSVVDGIGDADLSRDLAAFNSEMDAVIAAVASSNRRSPDQVRGSSLASIISDFGKLPGNSAKAKDLQDKLNGLEMEAVLKKKGSGEVCDVCKKLCVKF